VDVQAKEQAEAVRCLSLERESRTFEELVHLRGAYYYLKLLPSCETIGVSLPSIKSLFALIFPTLPIRLRVFFITIWATVKYFNHHFDIGLSIESYPSSVVYLIVLSCPSYCHLVAPRPHCERGEAESRRCGGATRGKSLTKPHNSYQTEKASLLTMCPWMHCDVTISSLYSPFIDFSPSICKGRALEVRERGRCHQGTAR
jgi:hypothetical protein